MKNSILFEKSDSYAHLVYTITKNFPKEEVYGITSQLRRAALSVPLNVVEGFARNSDKSFKQFLYISYGSLKESMYLLEFCHKEGLISENEYLEATGLGDEVGKISWALINKLKEKC